MTLHSTLIEVLGVLPIASPHTHGKISVNGLHQQMVVS